MSDLNLMAVNHHEVILPLGTANLAPIFPAGVEIFGRISENFEKCWWRYRKSHPLGTMNLWTRSVITVNEIKNVNLCWH